MANALEEDRLVARPRVEQVEDTQRRFFTPERLLAAGFLLTLLVVWEIAGRAVGTFFLAPPSAMITASVELIRTGQLLEVLVQSIQSLILGLLLSAVVGIAIGFFLGWYRFAGRVANPFINAFYVIPIAALVPLLIIWFGLGLLPRIIVVFLFSLFEITIATMNGVANVDPTLVEVARSFGVKKQWDMFRKVVFYNALPFVFTGLRIGASRAVKGMVTGELLFAVTGIGGLIVRYGSAYRTDMVFVLIVVITLVGVVTNAAVHRLHRWLAPWVVE